MVRKKSGGNGAASGVLPPRAMSLREFGHRLDEMLLDRGWSQADLHRKTELSKDTISKWVAGKVEPNPYNLARVADVFGISVDELYPNYLDNVANTGRRAVGGVEFNSSDLKTGILTIERRVSIETAAKIKELLDADDAAADGA